MTVIVGGLLSSLSVLLKDDQKKAVELDTKKAILKSVMDISPEDNIETLYGQRIVSFVVNYKGDVVEKDASGDPIVAENVNMAKEYKKSKEEKLFPVFKFVDASNKNQVDAYILPMFGNGLWNNIWGYLALEKDLNTIKGVVFDHTGETPGLGARITEESVQDRYTNKLIFDQQGKLVSVNMLKGEGNSAATLGEHKVDGMSGATLTGKGVNEMFYTYLSYYLPYIKKQQ